MPQRFATKEKIGTLTNLGASVQLAASKLTIGGQQYVTSTLTVAYPSLTAMTLYMIYAVQTAGVVSLVISQNFNSVGPSGYSSWKLVGAFYANGLGTPTFGSFVNLEGVPRTSDMAVAFTGPGFGTITVQSSWAYRSGDKFIAKGTFTLGTVSAVNASIVLPSISVDTAKKSAQANTQLVGELRRLAGAATQDYQVGNTPGGTVGGLGSQASAIFFDGSTTDRLFIARKQSSSAFDKEVTNNFLLTGEVMNVEFELPISGWSTTPIKDL